MQFADIEAAFADGSKEAVSDMASEISSLNDINALRAIAARSAEFIKLYSQYKANCTDYSLNRCLNRAAHIITMVSGGHCRCKIYTSSLSSDAGCEARAGFVTIITEKHLPELWRTEYLCACVFCGKQFEVVEEPSGHFTACKWSKVV
ncbi:MAG: hypothetical protein U1F46_15015 [Marinagarivorans sp.]